MARDQEKIALIQEIGDFNNPGSPLSKGDHGNRQIPQEFIKECWGCQAEDTEQGKPPGHAYSDMSEEVLQQWWSRDGACSKAWGAFIVEWLEKVSDELGG